MDIIFKNKDHEKNYQFILEKMKGKLITEPKQALAYLFALDENCFEHLLDLYDFYENEFILSGLWKLHNKGQKTARLAFNLWNGWCSEGEKYVGEDLQEDYLPSIYYSPCNIFNCENGIYYFEAIKLRYPKYYNKEQEH